MVFNRVLPAEWANAPKAADPLGGNLGRWAAEASRHDALRRAFAANTGVTPFTIPWPPEAPDTPEGLADLLAAAGLERLS